MAQITFGTIAIMASIIVSTSAATISKQDRLHITQRPVTEPNSHGARVITYPGECVSVPRSSIPTEVTIRWDRRSRYQILQYASPYCSGNPISVSPIDYRIVLNDRWAICSFSLERPLPSASQISVSFIGEGGRQATEVVHGSYPSCSNICSGSQWAQYPKSVNITGNYGTTDATISLFADSRCRNRVASNVRSGMHIGGGGLVTQSFKICQSNQSRGCVY